MRARLAPVLAASLMLGACAGTVPAAKPTASRLPPLPKATTVVPRAGLESVLGQPANAITALFGRPQLDIHEGAAHKMQFANATCVIDVYLYPPRDKAVAVATHIDARTPDGRDSDRARCVEALRRR